MSKEELLTTITFSSTTAAFGGIALFSLIQALKNKSYKKQISNSLAVLILAIAYIHYLKLRSAYENKNFDNVVLYRYSDWFVTVPLLIVEFFVILDWIVVDDTTRKVSIPKNHVIPFILSIVGSIFMLYTGYIYETTKENKWLYIGFLGLAMTGVGFVWMNNIKKIQKNKNWVIWFILIWILYGFAAYSTTNRNLYYNILDLIAKGVFALTIALT